MQKIALFLCSISLVIGASMLAKEKPVTKEKQHKQIAVEAEQLTPEMWDQQLFAPLATEHKMEVIGIVQATQQCFQNMSDAVDKGVDTFWESLGLIVQIYGQVAKGFMPRAELCLSMSPVVKEVELRLPMMKALEILPSVKEVFESATRFLPTNKENMTEQDIKRAMNKAFRNKETKAELKTILKKQCAEINGYSDYINAMYAQEVAELKAQVQAQMQELLSAMQERQS
jgi:hypothetical protein